MTHDISVNAIAWSDPPADVGLTCSCGWSYDWDRSTVLLRDVNDAATRHLLDGAP
jgi:hypothetical protein